MLSVPRPDLVEAVVPTRRSFVFSAGLVHEDSYAGRPGVFVNVGGAFPFVAALGAFEMEVTVATGTLELSSLADAQAKLTVLRGGAFVTDAGTILTTPLVEHIVNGGTITLIGETTNSRTIQSLGGNVLQLGQCTMDHNRASTSFRGRPMCARYGGSVSVDGTVGRQQRYCGSVTCYFDVFGSSR
jgi:hypothetical protein